MKKEFILKKNLEFQNVISLKNQLINKFIILYYKNSDHFEIGISTPKKFANAVKRNLIKRQIKWILDTSINYVAIEKQVVLIVRKDFINLSIDDKKKCIVKMFKKLEQGK